MTRLLRTVYLQEQAAVSVASIPETTVNDEQTPKMAQHISMHHKMKDTMKLSHSIFYSHMPRTIATAKGVTISFSTHSNFCI